MGKPISLKNVDSTFVKQAGAEFAKYYLDGQMATMQSTNLKLFVAATILPLVQEAVLIDLCNQSGNLTNAGAEFTIETLPQSQAKGNQLDFTRFKTITYFVSRGTWDTIREFPYTNPNKKDYDLAGLTDIFEKYIGRIVEVMRNELDKELTEFLYSTTLSGNVREDDANSILLDPLAFENNKRPEIILQLSTLLVKAKNTGMIPTGKAIDLVVRGVPLTKYKLIVSSTMHSILKRTISNGSFGPQQEKALFAGLEYVGTWEGIPVIESQFFEARGINYALFPTEELSPISFGFAYLETASDKVNGSATQWLTNTEYRYGMFAIKPLHELVYLSVQTGKKVASGVIQTGRVSSNQVEFSANISGTDAISTSTITVDVITFDGLNAGTATPTLDAEGNVIGIINITPTGNPLASYDKDYLLNLSITPLAGTKVLLDTVIFRTTMKSDVVLSLTTTNSATSQAKEAATETITNTKK